MAEPISAFIEILPVSGLYEMLRLFQETTGAKYQWSLADDMTVHLLKNGDPTCGTDSEMCPVQDGEHVGCDQCAKNARDLWAEHRPLHYELESEPPSKFTLKGVEGVWRTSLDWRKRLGIDRGPFGTCLDKGLFDEAAWFGPCAYYYSHHRDHRSRSECSVGRRWYRIRDVAGLGEYLHGLDRHRAKLKRDREARFNDKENEGTQEQQSFVWSGVFPVIDRDRLHNELSVEEFCFPSEDGYAVSTPDAPKPWNVSLYEQPPDSWWTLAWGHMARRRLSA